MYFFFMIEWTAKPTGVYIFSYTAQQERARTHRKKSSPTSQHHTQNNKRLVSMPTTRRSRSSCVSAVAISGSEQQENPVLYVDPRTSAPIDVDKDDS